MHTGGMCQINEEKDGSKVELIGCNHGPNTESIVIDKGSQNLVPTSTREQRAFRLDELPVHSQGRSRKDGALCGSRGLNGHSSAKRHDCNRAGHFIFVDATSTREQRAFRLDELPVHSQGRSRKDGALCGSRGLNGHSTAKRQECNRVDILIPIAQPCSISFQRGGRVVLTVGRGGVVSERSGHNGGGRGRNELTCCVVGQCDL
ncbi:MAG: hypothetical protein J3R72DRAFT_100588 [Linnemannia gamsii]|nr:MAG: hypothetical protein J3R72DRAFT_100588 [Linnemannia gamsii]